MQLAVVKAPNLLRAVLLLLFTGFLVHLVTSHDIFMLVSPLIASIVKISIVVFAVVTFGSMAASIHLNRRASDDQAGHDHDSHFLSNDHHHWHDDDAHPDHGHQHVSTGSLWGRITTGLLIAFIGLAFTWQPTVLGSNMLGQAPVAEASVTSSPAGATAAANQASAASAAADAASYYNSEGATVQTPGQFSAATLAVDYESDPHQFLGRTVSLQGFVYHPVGLPRNEFIVTRFFIVCCIMDMVPWGVAVISPHGADFKNNAWVSVTGRIGTQDLPQLQNYDPTSWVPNGSKQPVLQADSVARIPVPRLPYMVPNY